MNLYRTLLYYITLPISNVGFNFVRLALSNEKITKANIVEVIKGIANIFKSK